MTETTQRNLLAELLQGRAAYPEPAAEGLRRLRARALERANALTVPSVRDEDWRFTDLAPLYKGTFQPSTAPAAVDPALLAAVAVPEAHLQLLFCDGHFVGAHPGMPLSRGAESLQGAVSQRGAGSPPGVNAEQGVHSSHEEVSLQGATSPQGSKSLPQSMSPLHSMSLPQSLSLPRGLTLDVSADALGTLADFEHDAFVALNTAYVKDAAVIRAGREADAIVHIVHVAQCADGASYPRLFLQAAGGARLTVIEEFIGAEGAALVNSVTEVDVEAGAHLCHVRLQRQPASHFHIGQVSARVGRDATFASHSITLGSRLSRSNVHIVQAGEGAHCRLDGLAVLNGRQHADTHSFMDHAVPHGASEQAHKCIVDDGARAVFNGRILVRKGAQLTNAAQQSRNLLLSARARVDTKPQLEIFADDVKCAHGATVGQLEAEEIFYLRSRGLSPDAARALLTYAFAAEVIERIPVASVVRRLREEVLTRTNKGITP